MKGRLGRLGADTAVYGIGTAAGRFLNFILVPFYTNVLRPEEYGVVAYLYSIIAFANVVYWMGMESAYFRYAAGAPEAEQRKTFASAMTLIAGVSLAISAAVAPASGPIASALGLPGAGDYVTYSAGILFLDALAVIPFASLRLAGRAGAFAAIKFLNVVVNITANIALIVGFGYGVEGVFLGGLLASGLTILMLSAVVPFGGFRPDAGRIKAMMRFGLPTVPAGLSMIALQVVDRPILLYLTDAATVGLYQVSYRLGIFMMLVVSMFEVAWKPFIFRHANDPDASALFSRVVTSLAAVLFPLFVLFVFFIPDLARLEIFGVHVIHPDYWPGLAVVPLVLLGYLFLGLATGFSAGIYIAGKTNYLPLITGSAAGLNILLNFILVPRFGILGAGWATCLAYFGMAMLYYYVSGNAYPIVYDTGRIAKIAFASVSVILALSLVPPTVWPVSILVKLGLLLMLPLLLIALGVVRPGEFRAALRSMKSGG